MRTSFFPVAGILWILAPAPAAAQTAMERATARETADAGRAQFDAGHYVEAIDSFSRAQQLVAAPPHLLYIARAQAKLGRLIEAHENYLKIIRDTLPPKPPKAFTDAVHAAERELEAVDARLAYVTIAVQGAPASGVSVQMDSVALPAAMVGIPFPVDPGAHAFQAGGSAVHSAPVTVTLAEGGKETVLLTLRANPRPAPSPGAAPAPVSSAAPSPVATSASPTLTTEPAISEGSHSSGTGSGLRVAGYVTLGVGAVGLGIGSYFFVKSSSTRASSNSAFDACDPGCSAPERAQIASTDQQATRERNVGIGVVAAGGAAAITGITLLLFGSRGSATGAQSHALHLAPVLGLGSLGLTGTF